MTGELKADKGEIRKYVSLYKHADQGTYLALRGFYEKVSGTETPRHPWRKRSYKFNGAGSGPLVEQLGDFAEDCANAEKRVVCSHPVCTYHTLKNAKGENLANGLVLMVESDEAAEAARKKLEGILGPATMVVASGGVWTDPETGDKEDKLHAYWRLKIPTRTPEEHALLREARYLMAKLVGADISAASPVHPLRMQGSWHRKGKPRLARSIAFDDSAEVDLEEALELLCAAAEVEGVKTWIAASTPESLRGAIEDVEAALDIIPNHDDEWGWWRSKIMLATVGAAGEEGREAFKIYSAKSDKYDEDDTDAQYDAALKSPPNRIGYGTLAFLARQADPDWLAPSELALRESAEKDFTPLCVADDPPILDLGAPYKIAKKFVDHHFTDNGSRILHHHRGEFFRQSSPAYTAFSPQAVRALLYSFLDGCVAYGPKGKLYPVKPKSRLVSDVADALRAKVHLDDTVSPPAWLDHASRPLAHEIVACTNGLLHLPSLDLLPHTPAFFTQNALDFAFDPGAPAPKEWLNFLDQLWPDDSAAIETLQEIFGLSLTGDTSHQKAFLLVGPKRSGKGTIARILARLIGSDNTVAPTLAGLGTNFGLQPLIGKQVAIISDARLGGRADQQAIAERLLTITGEDGITFDRKNLTAWTGRLQVRFIILSNELPRIADVSGALASRFIVLLLKNSFFGREDRGLTDRLSGELPGVLNWSIAGWKRLNERGYFKQPKSAARAARQLEDLGSPIRVFLRERCTLAAGERVEVEDLFDSWRKWCEAQGRKYTGDAQLFGRDLRTALPDLKIVQVRIEGDRVRMYKGIGLR